MPFGFRPDGDRVKGLPPVHAIMPFLFPTRTESVVFFELLVDGARMQPFLDEMRAKTGAKVNLLHVVIAAVTKILSVERPRLNRFVVGGRVYQRRGVWSRTRRRPRRPTKAPWSRSSARMKPTGT